MIFGAFKLYCNEFSAEINARSENLSFFLSFYIKTQHILICFYSKEGEDGEARCSDET